MRTFDFFADITDFVEVVPGIDKSTTLASMQASHERSKQKLISVLTAGIYDELKTGFGGVNNDPELDQAIEYIQGAHGNMIAYFEMISKVIAKKKENVNYFKYEIHMMQENYLDAFAVHMDLLLDYLDANTTYFDTWAASPTYTMRQSLVLKSANQFNSVFPTGGSGYFFNLATPFQSMVVETEILPRKKLADIPSDLLKTVQYFVAYRTMAKAVMLVDFVDLPKSMRQKLYAEESKKNSNDMETVSERYAKQFNAEADRYLHKIDLELQKPADDVSELAIPPDDFNLESDSTYVIV